MTDPAIPAEAPSTSAPTIVVGVVGSPSSIAALRWAVGLAPQLGATVEAVTSWTETSLIGDGWTVLPEAWDPDQVARETSAQALSDAFGDQIPTLVRASIDKLPPARALIERGADATMIVVGSRGRGGFAGLLLGSVSSACTQHAQCPVLVVKGDDVPPFAPPA